MIKKLLCLSAALTLTGCSTLNFIDRFDKVAAIESIERGIKYQVYIRKDTQEVYVTADFAPSILDIALDYGQRKLDIPEARLEIDAVLQNDAKRAAESILRPMGCDISYSRNDNSKFWRVTRRSYKGDIKCS